MDQAPDLNGGPVWRPAVRATVPDPTEGPTAMHNTKRRLMTALATTTLAAVLLAGCGGGESGDSQAFKEASAEADRAIAELATRTEHVPAPAPVKARPAPRAARPKVESKPAPPPAPAPVPEVADLIEASVEEHLGGGATDYGSPRNADALCVHGFCSVSYNADTPAFDVEGELIDAQRPIFQDAFAIPTVKLLTIETSGQTTSVGGKDSISPVMTITCDRAANRQIDWGRIDAGGVKQLCIYAALVDLG